MTKKSAAKAQEANMVKQPDPAASTVTASTPTVAPAGADQAAQSEQPQPVQWPQQFKVTNNTPIALYLSEAGVTLPPNFNAPDNTAVVTFKSEDALIREKANADAIGKAHGFSDVLIVDAAE